MTIDKWDTNDLDYLAGFLDGEGCFSVGQNWKIAVSCSNADPRPISLLKDMFGGSTRIAKGRKPNHRHMHTWQIVSKKAAKVCQVLAPRLKIKAEQALLLMAIDQTMGRYGNPLSQEIKDERNRLALLTKELKYV